MWGLFILKVIYIFLIGFALAVLEIQIEGKYGWAEKLPTWRPVRGSFLEKSWLRLTKKDLTGYHISLMVILLLFFHLPFIWTGTWSYLMEFEVLAFFVFFAVFWDFLWFVLNPDYSIKDFGPKKVWWHRSWLGRLPTDYYIATLITGVLFVPSILINPLEGVLKYILLVGGITFLTLITMFVYPKTN